MENEMNPGFVLIVDRINLKSQQHSRVLTSKREILLNRIDFNKNVETGFIDILSPRGPVE